MHFHTKVFFLTFLSFSCVIQASINDYIYKNNDVASFSNYGSVGLIQMPTARFHEEGTLASVS